jgi:hypothetical protein
MEEKLTAFRKNQELVISRLNSLAVRPMLFRLYLLKILPMGFFAGLRIDSVTREKCVVTVPYKWLNKNPFRSIYFAVLGMGAELSTGFPAFSFTWKAKPAISMLITGVRGEFSKKATGRIYFTFDQLAAMQEAIEKTIISGEGETFECVSVGRSKDGKEVARFYFTWSFRVKIALKNRGYGPG